ncbi:hypothetical protein [Microcoleus sp. FACHB-68]|uniref:hypothetical protein n=1 Tax=Microcoleus sp. FACHB-68 TaxID=2692826 RepID=UPI00168662ED|nr:hypothetical protein [Microcoleus sp. FACHB-68]MBD1937526.1 hypothetical protein [Microcoleus sp. FACHB-68]
MNRHRQRAIGWPAAMKNRQANQEVVLIEKKPAGSVKVTSRFELHTTLRTAFWLPLLILMPLVLFEYNRFKRGSGSLRLNRPICLPA